jgi:hypothetical protein
MSDKPNEGVSGAMMPEKEGGGTANLKPISRSGFHVGRRGALAAVVLAVVAIGVVVAFVTFTQYFPAVPPTPPGSNFVANCGTSLSAPLIPTPGSVVPGTAGAIVYSCVSGTAAISVTNATVNATPTEAPAVGAGGMPNTLSLITPGAPCTPTAGLPMAQSTPMDIPVGGYNYCATYTSAPVTGIVSFTVAWA